MNRIRRSPLPCTRREFMRTAGAAGLGLVAARRAGAWTARPSAATAPLTGIPSEPPLRARLEIDVERQLGSIDPNIYGNFTEHLGRCIYGGIYDEGSPLSDSEGNRKDVIEAARQLRVTQLRWPGGNFASGYHWQDGIGPKDARPARYDLAWFEREPNRFGTDEFIATCRKIGGAPYLCVNMGSGTMDEAASWVEYCNHAGGTYYSDLRKRNGHAEPYGVKLWGLGNEVWGSWQIGHQNAADYAKAAREFAKVMKWQDPSIKLVACGNGDPDWDGPVLEAVADLVDYISAHHYTVTGDLKEDYYEIVGAPVQMERIIRASEQTAERYSARAHKRVPIAIAFDEWNIINNWSSGQKRDDTHKFESNYNLRDALWVAAAFNAIHRHSKTVRLANLAQLVNVIAPIATSPTGILLKTIYYPLALYANHAGPVALDVAVTSPKFKTTHFGEQDYLDAMGTYDEAKRRVTVAVVNRRQEGDVVASVLLAGSRAKSGGRAYVITGASPAAENTFENPHAVVTEDAEFTASGDRWDYRFPPHSISWLEFEVES